ncbi:MAG: HlyD family type I secretion periplasmic adaptor subunit [Porticoccaceae bacterium]|nr:HlyD family type I secretion periplasmic adaptor subunit [Porticoccaceae bacterium]
MQDQLSPLQNQPLRNRTLVVLCLSLLAFSVWIALAPVESAVLAKGHIRAMGDSKPIQHLRGGKIVSINVRSGAQVAKGEILLQLDITEQQSALKANLRDYLMTLLEMEVAQTHLRKLEQLQFSEKVILLAVRLQENQLLTLRQQSFRETIERKNNQLALLESRAEQLQLSTQAQKIEHRTQLERVEMLGKQYSAAEALAVKNYVSKIQLDEIYQQLISARGDIEITEQKIAASESGLLQIPIQNNLVISELRQQASQDNNRAMQRIISIEDNINQLKNRIANATVRASQDGVITHLKRKNPGETVLPGQEIMRLLPNGEELLIEARIRPTDIDLLWLGQTARIRLSAFNARATPLLEGVVHWVSADRHQDAQGYYFIAELRVDKNQLDRIPKLHLTSGMPAEAILITDKRTIADYLFEPLLRGINRSLRER